MIKINYKALLKALSSLFIPTISVCIFTFFLVLDINKLINIIFGPNIYSILIRLGILLMELFLFYKMYKYYESKEIMNKIIQNIKDPETFSKNLNAIYSQNITIDRYNDINISGWNENSNSFVQRFLVEKNVKNNVNIYEIDNFVDTKIISNETTEANEIPLPETQNNKIKYFLVKTEIID